MNIRNFLAIMVTTLLCWKSIDNPGYADTFSSHTLYNKANQLSESFDCRKFARNYGYSLVLRENLGEDGYAESHYSQSTRAFEIIYFSSGSIKAIVEVDEALIWNGWMHSWYETGEYLGCANLIGEQHDGISIAYHKNGTKRAIAFFLNGKQINNEYQYFETGEVRAIRILNRNGEEVTSYRWSKDGVLVETKTEPIIGKFEH